MCVNNIGHCGLVQHGEADPVEAAAEGLLCGARKYGARDGDYVPLVEYLKLSSGCQVEVVSFGKSTSSKLIDAADDFIDLDKKTQKYLIH